LYSFVSGEETGRNLGLDHLLLREDTCSPSEPPSGVASRASDGVAGATERSEGGRWDGGCWVEGAARAFPLVCL